MLKLFKVFEVIFTGQSYGRRMLKGLSPGIFFLIFLNFSHRMPHRCHGNAGKCPSRSHPIWELPINELDRRDDVDFDERLSGCSLVSSCSNLYEPAQFKGFLENNFQRYSLFFAFFTFSKCACTHS